MLELYEIPWSTNVERVTLALAHKGVEVKTTTFDAADRSQIVAASGQELVPVLIDGDMVVHDSPVILGHLEERFPDPPLYPADPARRAEVQLFVDWFNEVWKGPPNEIDDELAKPEPDRSRIAELERWMRDAQDVFETLLAGRDHLMGDFGIADVVAFPFLKYGLIEPDPDDDEPFHRILHDNLPLDGRPRLEDWIRRMDARPRA